MNQDFDKLDPAKKIRRLNYFESRDNEFKELRERIIESTQELYRESNKLEVFVLTGSFGIVINILLIPTEAHKFLLFLVFGLSLIVFAIILKSHIHRLTARKFQKEMEMLEQRHLIETEYIFKDINKEEYRKKSADVSKKYDPFFKIRGIIGSFLNELEFCAFASGIILILIFFILNTQ